MTKYLYLFLFFLCLGTALLAQDPHYSFFTANALGTNPALAGQISENHSRIQLSYRNQWSTVLDKGAFQTAFASYDRRICIPFLRGSYIGVGASMIGDTRGEYPLRRADVLGSASLIVTLGKNSDYVTYLSAGGEAGWIGHRVGTDDLTFDDQFDTPGLAPEITALASSNVADYGAGGALTIASRDQKEGVNLQLGIAIKHLTKPALTYYETSDELTPRLEQQVIYHLGFSFSANEKVKIPIQAIYRVQQPHRQLLASVGAQYAMTDRTNVLLSGGLRISRSFDGFRQDALIPRVSILDDRFQFTASYDVNLSSLRRASAYVGSLELMLGYNFGDGGCDIVFCPFF